MEITWYGHSCFRITERNMASVVTDPFDHAAVGYSALKLRADIVTVSQDDPGHNFVKAVKGAKWQNNGLNMAFVFDYDGVNLAHLGAIKTVPSRKEVEAFGSVDILLVPVGGESSLAAAKAAEVVNLIEPGIVVPMQYSTPDTTINLNSLNDFLKQMGLGSKYEEQESLKVRKRDIPEETRVIVLAHKKPT
jgi:L-ascorbate metabolism protein UlaG (beta-lactamase superfamily)